MFEDRLVGSDNRGSVLLGLPWHEINFHKETGLFQSETGKLFISTFTFLKVCLKGKLSKGSIKKIVRPIHKTKVIYAKVHNPRSIYISEECMGLYGISDVPACQVCSYSVLPATNTFSHIHCQYQTIQMLKVKVFREEVKKYIS